MQADFRVVLDACVLANISVCDLFLRLAETPRMYVPKWSKEILDEVGRVHQKLDWPPALASSWREQVEKWFPESMVTGYEPFLPIATNEEGDRHVLAAAICANAELIVTFNLRHFPGSSLNPFGMYVMHPSEYLIKLFGMNPGVVVSKLDEMTDGAKRTRAQLLTTLHQSVPAFAVFVADSLSWEF